MEPATTLRFRHALVFLRHQLRNGYPRRQLQQQRRTNVNMTDGAVKKGFDKTCVSSFINKGLGDMKSISEPTKGLMATLEERGFINQFHGDKDEFAKLADEEVLEIYAGADATAKSLHLGHMMVIMPMLHCMLHGHKISLLIGNATARVGDPSGRTTEREGMRDQKLGKRVFEQSRAITQSLSMMLKFAIQHAVSKGYDRELIGRRGIMDNLQWHRNVSIIDFFQIIGPRARLGEMMLRKSVSERIKSKDGISYGEFSYQLFQAIDYWHLFSSHGCRLQIGGSDQWGNITAGCDLINRMVNEAAWIDDLKKPQLVRNLAKPYGLTVPLLTNANGEKISKTTGGDNIWISPTETPPFTLYQFLLNRPDDVMEQWLKYFTLLKIEEIDQIMQLQKAEPEKRHAQRTLAFEVVALIHGFVAARDCIQTTAVFFGQNWGDEAVQKRAEVVLQSGLTMANVNGVSSHDHWKLVLESEVMHRSLINILVFGGISPSKSQAKTLLESGALSVGPRLEKLPTDKPAFLTEDMIISDGQRKVVVFKVGKNKIHIVWLVETQEEIEKIQMWRDDPELAKKAEEDLKKKSPRQKRVEKRRNKIERRIEKNKAVKEAQREALRPDASAYLEAKPGIPEYKSGVRITPTITRVYPRENRDD